jgi:hypothetical protein
MDDFRMVADRLGLVRDVERVDADAVAADQARPERSAGCRSAGGKRSHLAIGQWPKRMKNVKKLCRRLGLGLMVVAAERADIALDPLPYRPRLNKRKAGHLPGEHARRVGDLNSGGSTTKVPMMTAFRQEALRCAEFSASNGPTLRMAADAPRAATILQQDVYGWFEWVERGVNALIPAGRRELATFARRRGSI